MNLNTQRSTQADYTGAYFKCNYFFTFFPYPLEEFSRAVSRKQSEEHPCNSMTLVWVFFETEVLSSRFYVQFYHYVYIAGEMPKACQPSSKEI